MTELVEPEAIQVDDLFSPDRLALLELLAELTPEEWALPTVCPGWDVRDVALHVLGGDLANVAIRRDGVAYLGPAAGEDLTAFINRINSEWVTAARRLTPTLIRELLEFTAEPVARCMAAGGGPVVDANVSWASAGPVPRWLDIAREYMERWVHQQHIRDAVGRPGQDGGEFAAPVIAASMFALVPALRSASAGTFAVDVEGDGGGSWAVIPLDGDRKLRRGKLVDADARLHITAGDWWRTVTLGMTPEQALAGASVEGDQELARAALGAVAIIA